MNSTNRASKRRAKASASLSQRISLWISARAQRGTRFTLSQKNIYIFPSRSGFGFSALLLLMLVTAINYQSSLVYMLTFLLGAVFFVSIWLCFLNLRGLQIESGESQGVFALQTGCFRVRLLHPQQPVYGLALAVSAYDRASVSLEPGEVKIVDVPAQPLPRGRYCVDRLLIETYYPFGLIRGWTWLKLDVECLVYPAPIAPPVEGYVGSDSASSAGQTKGGDKDVLRSYQSGDTLARVHWKKFASSDQLVVRDQGLVAPDRHWLRWEDFPEADHEQRLSYLCEQILARQKAGEEYGLMIPGRRIELRSGQKHMGECLAALADFGGRASGPKPLPFDVIEGGAK